MWNLVDFNLIYGTNFTAGGVITFSDEQALYTFIYHGTSTPSVYSTSGAGLTQLDTDVQNITSVAVLWTALNQNPSALAAFKSLFSTGGETGTTPSGSEINVIYTILYHYNDGTGSAVLIYGHSTAGEQNAQDFATALAVALPLWNAIAPGSGSQVANFLSGYANQRNASPSTGNDDNQLFALLEIILKTGYGQQMMQDSSNSSLLNTDVSNMVSYLNSSSMIWGDLKSDPQNVGQGAFQWLFGPEPRTSVNYNEPVAQQLSILLDIVRYYHTSVDSAEAQKIANYISVLWEYWNDITSNGDSNTIDNLNFITGFEGSDQFTLNAMDGHNPVMNGRQAAAILGIIEALDPAGAGNELVGGDVTDDLNSIVLLIENVNLSDFNLINGTNITLGDPVSYSDLQFFYNYLWNYSGSHRVYSTSGAGLTQLDTDVQNTTSVAVLWTALNQNPSALAAFKSLFSTGGETGTNPSGSEINALYIILYHLNDNINGASSSPLQFDHTDASIQLADNYVMALAVVQPLWAEIQNSSSSITDFANVSGYTDQGALPTENEMFFLMKVIINCNYDNQSTEAPQYFNYFEAVAKLWTICKGSSATMNALNSENGTSGSGNCPTNSQISALCKSMNSVYNSTYSISDPNIAAQTVATHLNPQDANGQQNYNDLYNAYHNGTGLSADDWTALQLYINALTPLDGSTADDVISYLAYTSNVTLDEAVRNAEVFSYIIQYNADILPYLNLRAMPDGTTMCGTFAEKDGQGNWKLTENGAQTLSYIALAKDASNTYYPIDQINQNLHSIALLEENVNLDDFNLLFGTHFTNGGIISVQDEQALYSYLYSDPQNQPKIYAASGNGLAQLNTDVADITSAAVLWTAIYGNSTALSDFKSLFNTSGENASGNPSGSEINVLYTILYHFNDNIPGAGSSPLVFDHSSQGLQAAYNFSIALTVVSSVMAEINRSVGSAPQTVINRWGTSISSSPTISQTLQIMNIVLNTNYGNQLLQDASDSSKVQTDAKNLAEYIISADILWGEILNTSGASKAFFDLFDPRGAAGSMPSMTQLSVLMDISRYSSTQVDDAEAKVIVKYISLLDYVWVTGANNQQLIDALNQLTGAAGTDQFTLNGSLDGHEAAALLEIIEALDPNFNGSYSDALVDNPTTVDDIIWLNDVWQAALKLTFNNNSMFVTDVNEYLVEFKDDPIDLSAKHVTGVLSKGQIASLFLLIGPNPGTDVSSYSSDAEEFISQAKTVFEFLDTLSTKTYEGTTLFGLINLPVSGIDALNTAFGTSWTGQPNSLTIDDFHKLYAAGSQPQLQNLIEKGAQSYVDSHYWEVYLILIVPFLVGLYPAQKSYKKKGIVYKGLNKTKTALNKLIKKLASKKNVVPNNVVPNNVIVQTVTQILDNLGLKGLLDNRALPSVISKVLWRGYKRRASVSQALNYTQKAKVLGDIMNALNDLLNGWYEGDTIGKALANIYILNASRPGTRRIITRGFVEAFLNAGKIDYDIAILILNMVRNLPDDLKETVREEMINMMVAGGGPISMISIGKTLEIAEALYEVDEYAPEAIDALAHAARAAYAFAKTIPDKTKVSDAFAEFYQDALKRLQTDKNNLPVNSELYYIPRRIVINAGLGKLLSDPAMTSVNEIRIIYALGKIEKLLTPGASYIDDLMLILTQQVEGYLRGIGGVTNIDNASLARIYGLLSRFAPANNRDQIIMGSIFGGIFALALIASPEERRSVLKTICFLYIKTRQILKKPGLLMEYRNILFMLGPIMVSLLIS